MPLHAMGVIGYLVAQHAMVLTRGNVRLSHYGDGMFLLRNEACRQVMHGRHAAERLRRE